MRLVLAFPLILVALPALAQQDGQRDLGEQGRYALQRAGDAVVRVDRRTGAVSRCTETNNRWQCAAVAEEREALEAEIGRLSDENAQLKRRLASLEGKGGGAKDQNAFNLPSREDVDRAVGWLEGMMQRVGPLLEWLRRQIEGEPERPQRS